MKNRLLYLQDVGGVNYILPVLDEIIKEYNPTILVHQLAEKYIRLKINNFVLLSDIFENAPVSESEISKYLIQNGINSIFCTTSSPFKDLTNSNLIKAAKEIQIPCIGIFDHWKGVERFFGSYKYPVYLPDTVLCIDEFCKKIISDACSDLAKIKITGHPFLEKFLSNQQYNSIEQKRDTKILLVSQPITRDYSFKSFFQQVYGDSILLNKIIEVPKNYNSIEFYYRQHPKETSNNITGNIKNDISESNRCLSMYDIFIGFDSMLLLEANLSGKQVLRLELPGLEHKSTTNIPYEYGTIIKDLHELKKIIENFSQNKNSRHIADYSKWEDILKDSKQRVLSFLSTEW